MDLLPTLCRKSSLFAYETFDVKRSPTSRVAKRRDERSVGKRGARSESQRSGDASPTLCDSHHYFAFQIIHVKHWAICISIGIVGVSWRLSITRERNQLQVRFYLLCDCDTDERKTVDMITSVQYLGKTYLCHYDMV